MKNQTPFETQLLLFVWAVVIAFLLFMAAISMSHAQEPVACPQVCPSCNVKAEWTETGYQYEYTDNTAVVTGTMPISVCWQASSGYAVSSVCIKAGQMLFHPEPSLGCWTTPWQDISHVVVCTEKPTAITLAEFRAISQSEFSVMLFLLGCVGMLSGLCIIAWVERRREHELYTTRGK